MFYFILFLGYELKFGSEVVISSHNYPYYYPASAYALWTFQYAHGEDHDDLSYQISFGYVRLYSYDYLTVGRGWDRENSTAIVVSYHSSGYPDNAYIDVGRMFVEFKTNSYSQYYGFQLNLIAIYTAGKYERMIMRR